MAAWTLGGDADQQFRAIISDRLGAAWKLDRYCTVLESIIVVQLSHPSDGFEVWYTDPDGTFLGNSQHLPNDYLIQMQGLVERHLAPLLRRLLFETRPDVSHELDQFLGMDTKVVRDVLSKGSLSIAQRPLVIDPTATPITIARPNDETALNLPFATEAASFDLKTALLDAPLNGLTIPNPIDGTQLQNEGAFYIGEMHYYYRFPDHRHGLVYYVLAGYADIRSYAIYVPASDLLIANPTANHITRIASGAVSAWFNMVIVAYGRFLHRATTMGAERFAYVLQGPPWLHIGHQLWNDLSGIEHYLESGRRADVLSWIVQDGTQEVEIFAALDNLFPELHGHVVRGIKNQQDLARHLVETGTIPVRFTSEYISASLRDRLQSNARSESSEMAADASRLRLRHPVIVLGLRVENRTLGDLAGFYALLVHCILDAFPNAVFIIDGRNADKSDRTFSSVGQTDRQNDLLMQERNIVADLRRMAPRAEIVDAVGLRLNENLFLLGLADYFICPWGAGLAKYRWVWNMPGFILSSNWNLTRRPDLRIYDDARCMQDPTPVTWLNAERVFDHAAIPVLVNSSAIPEYCNFWIDQTRTVLDILRDMQRVLNPSINTERTAIRFISS